MTGYSEKDMHSYGDKTKNASNILFHAAKLEAR